MKPAVSIYYKIIGNKKKNYDIFLYIQEASLYLFIFGLEKVSQTHSFERAGSAIPSTKTKTSTCVIDQKSKWQQPTTFLNFIIHQCSQVFLIIVQRRLAK